MRCHAVLSCAGLCCVVLNGSVLCRAVNNGAVLCRAVLNGAVLCRAVLSCAVLCCAVLKGAVLCRQVLHGAVLCCAGKAAHTRAHTSNFSFLLFLRLCPEITEGMFITETIHRKCGKKRTKVSQSETICGLTQ